MVVSVLYVTQLGLDSAKTWEKTRFPEKVPLDKKKIFLTILPFFSALIRGDFFLVFSRRNVSKNRPKDMNTAVLTLLAKSSCLSSRNVLSKLDYSSAHIPITLVVFHFFNLKFFHNTFLRTRSKRVWHFWGKIIARKIFVNFDTCVFRGHLFSLLRVKIIQILHGNNKDALLYHKVKNCCRLTVFWSQLLRKKVEKWADFWYFDGVCDFHFLNFVTCVFNWL